LFLGALIVKFEQGFMIKTIGDGLWWSITTVTGVGYGDLVPITGAGRLIGVVLMTVGLVLFSLVVAVLSAAINSRQEKYWTKRIRLELESINRKLYRMEKKMEYLIKEKKSL